MQQRQTHQRQPKQRQTHQLQTHQRQKKQRQMKYLSTKSRYSVLLLLIYCLTQNAMILSYPKSLCSWQVLIYSFYFFTSALISSIIITILFSLFILFFILSTKNAKNCYVKNGSGSLDQISLDLFSRSRVCYKFGTRLNAFFVSRMKVLLMNSFFLSVDQKFYNFCH